MNHKDFIKNYLPGLTRGVYAVRLLLKVAPTYIAALLICNILSGILTSIELLLSQNFLNSLTVFLSGYITIETLLFWLISIFLASVAMSGCTYVSSCLNSLVSDKFNLYITNRILEKTTFFSMKEYDNVDLYNKIHLALEETPNRCLTLLTTLFSTVRLTTQLIGITILIANYNVLILLVCIVTSIPMLRLSNRVGKFWYTVGAERAEGLRKCNRLKELLVEYNNIKEIKLFDIGDMLKNRVVRQQTDYVNSNKHYYKKFCRLNTVYAMAQDSVSLLLKIAIIMQAVTQKLTIGAASMYISSVDSFNASFQGMLSQISTLYEQTRYLSYISDIENISVRKQEEGTPLTEKIKSIRFENVSFHYPNSHNMVLKNFSYTFETGKTYALVGMNGSGKTTLIKLLMRLYTPINGHIYVNGVDIEEISFSSLQQQISAVFQDFIRYPFNVAENIAIHDADNINDFERVKEAAVHSEATEFIDALPLGYAANDAKTTRENQLFVSGVNCVPEIARQQMELTKQQFGKTGGTVAFHAYQSFRPGEVTPEQCHAIGLELAKRVWGDRFQVLVATHLNTDCCHNHFVINSVSFVDGKRYNDCKRTYRALQDASDELCREQGLSVVDKKDAHRVPRNLYLAEKAGEPTRYNIMRQDIDLAILRSETPRDLPRILRKMGYEVDFNPNHKYPTIKLPHDRRAVRFKTLGEEYTPQAMAQRIQQNHEMGNFKRMEIYNKRYPPVHPHYQKLRQDFRKAIMEAFGIYRTYLYYCYLLGKLPTATPNYRPPHPAMREDYRRWAEIEKQLHLLERHSLNTAEDVAAFTSEQEQKLTDLEARRTKCHNRLRRCRDPTECEALHTEKDELTKQITETRKELKTAQQIPARVKRMRENIQLLNDREQQRAAHRKER